MPFHIRRLEFHGQDFTENKMAVTKSIGGEGGNRFAPEMTGRGEISVASNTQYFTHVLASVIPNYNEI